MSPQKWIGVIGVACMALSAAAQSIAPAVTTSGGAANTIPMFTGSTDIENSVITQSNGNVGIGTTSPQGSLDVNGRIGTQSVKVLSSFTDLVNDAPWYGIGASNLLLPDSNGADAIQVAGYYGLNFQTAIGQMVITEHGNVGINTTTPGAKLEVNGALKLTQGSGGAIVFQDGTIQSTAYTGVVCGDFAESIDVSGDRKRYQPGDVLVIDPNAPGKFLKSAEPYSTAVLGVYSTKPGVLGRRQTTPKSPDEVPMAMVGIVPTKVSAENGAIRPGDLLVSSSKLGYAMKGTDRSKMLGAVIGKALGNLQTGTGVIEVGVTLQ